MSKMRRDTLLDFFEDFASVRAGFLVHDDGYRTRRIGYAETGSAARRFAGRLRAAGLAKGDRIVLWAENRPEWVIALWGALLEGVIVVPVDYRASADLVDRIRRIVSARLALVGDEVTVPALDPPIDTWPLASLLEGAPAGPAAPPRPASRDEVAEIIFTSGATADPKGVVITHRNVLANIVPVEREVLKYRRYAWPFRPIRFLNLLPLSHMFGQAMATFIPPMVQGEVIFMHGYNPQEIVHQIRSRRVSVLVCVPKILDVLREHVLRVAPAAAEEQPSGTKWYVRWWRHRDVHRVFGWKFWAFVVGAAPLDPDLEEFWRRLGFVVIQGYGLTETAPIVTLNHPFRTRRGSVGTPIAGVEVRIAPDGEILVRGENVTSGYYGAAAEDAAAFDREGWFHTGDIGALDEEGRLSVRGRKKEVIVTPEGLNVFPEDVERTLNALGGVRDSAAVGIAAGGEERVHAVLLLEPDADADAIVREANARLEDHQRIRGFSIWPGEELPRTEGTRKLKRTELRGWVAAGAGAAPKLPARGARLEDVIAQFTSGRGVGAATTLEELGLSSLERLELMMALEDRFQTTIDESAFARARSVGELHALLERPAPAAEQEPIEFPAWNRRPLARLIRRLSLPTWILPLARLFAWIRVEGVEHLGAGGPPVIFAANHQSHMDTPAILWALPARWRYRVAPAMAKEFFRAHFFPAQHSRRQRITNSLNYYLAALFFNAFPLPQREAGTRQTLRYAGELLGEGYSILIFPEGRRVEGAIAPFQPGVGMMGARLGARVVPVRIEGLDRVLRASAKFPRPGPVAVRFGRPLTLAGDDYAAEARRVEEAVRAL
jgi:long-chain acyl-CoA synthetase